jgi:hypothetical protein
MGLESDGCGKDNAEQWIFHGNLLSSFERDHGP